MSIMQCHVTKFQASQVLQHSKRKKKKKKKKKKKNLKKNTRKKIRNIYIY
jgi:hypothetical protein